jgi:hypothetical protein
MGMSIRANVLKVMIASPGDIGEERNIVTDEIYRWNDANASARQLVLLPVKWETHSTPEMGQHPQAIINRQLLNEADIVIALFGTRIGTPTEEYISGTVEEIKKHVAAGKTAKIYFSDVPVAPSAFDDAQYASVKKFREECQSDGLYATFNSIDQFRREFSQHLAIEMNQPRYRWLPTLQPLSGDDDNELSQDALRLLKTAAASDDGLVIAQEAFNSIGLHAGDEEFVDGSVRSAARWRAALAELVDSDAMEHVSEGIYRVSAIGFKIADSAADLKQHTTPQLSAFEDHQNTHTRGIVESLNFRQRDLLRLLLLKGGSARVDVVSMASANSSGAVDINVLCQPLIHKGLITRVENLEDGHSTFTVSSGISDVLKGLLFPRAEDTHAPFFSGIPVMMN